MLNNETKQNLEQIRKMNDIELLEFLYYFGNMISKDIIHTQIKDIFDIENSISLEDAIEISINR